MSRSLVGTFLLVCLILTAAGTAAHDAKPRLAVGAFTARKLAKAPVLDGKISPGEWDEALTTCGMLTPFGHELQECETTVSFGFDARRFYFLFQCRRGDREWKLWKKVRENDDYAFSDPSVEVWITPPRLVHETYQNVINTFPAVLDQHMIPTRGYTAQGWKGNWELGVDESDTHYTLEASVPIADFGTAQLAEGEIWRFLLCRTSPGTQPAPQASWSVTQGFAELGQHPPIKLAEDAPVVQFRNVTSLLTGNYEFPVTLAAPRGKAAKLTAELRWHKEAVPADGDLIEKQEVDLAAGDRKSITFKGAVPEAHSALDAKQVRRGYVTLSVSEAGGAEVFRQGFPYHVNGWAPKTPQRPADVPEAKPLDLEVKYGPETNVVILRADILDLPAKDQAAGGTVKVIDVAQDKALLTLKLPAFRNAYSNLHFFLDQVKVPVMDYVKQAGTEQQIKNIEKENKARAKEGKPLTPLPKLEIPEALALKLEVTVEDAAGKPLSTESSDLKALRYRFPWSNNEVGVTERVIPPYTPVTCQDDRIGVWNRSYRLDGLGLPRALKNDGLEQIKSVRMVAVQNGQETEFPVTAPRLTRWVDAQADLEGASEAAGLKLSAQTRVEFDGFVKSTLTIAPLDAKAGAAVEKLFLEIVLPEAEATHFCTTAGGWAAVHDVTPKHWTSQQTASGMMVGDFVPYIWLTNSDRAFLWAADSDQGWITDGDRSHPTQEIKRENGTVTLRIHFIELPTKLTQPTSLTHAWQAFPARPLPAGWRSIICGGSTETLPGAVNSYFWFEGDWAVLWPYYCSPYPWSMEKSRAAYDRFAPDTSHRPMVGSIAHSVGRYRDYDGRDFKAYAVDWGSRPGDSGNANCTAGRGPNDFRLYHYERWVKEAGFRGLYVDENYLALETNFLTGGAYFRPDGRLQPGYGYFGLREYFKRLKNMFHLNNVPEPNLWQHISSGAAYFAWPGDVFFEGENVEPTDEQFDYIEVLPSGRMRAIASARCSGGAMTMMCQSQRHATVFEAKHTHQFVGWVMAHDVLPEQVRWWNMLAQEAGFYREDVEFIGYWKPENPIKTATPDCAVSVHRSGKRALAWIVNTAREDREASVRVDWAKLGFDRARTVALDAETGALVALDEAGFKAKVLKRDFVAVHLIEPQQLKDGASFVATFDAGRSADEAYGNAQLATVGRLAHGRQLPMAGGVKGGALDAALGIELWPRLHVTDAEGRVAFQGLLKPGARGTIFATTQPQDKNAPEKPTLRVQLTKDHLVLERAGRDGKTVGEVVQAALPQPGWRAFVLSWKNGQVTLSVDGQPAGSLAIDGMNVGAGTGTALLQGGRFQFGGPRGALSALDELRCYRTAE